MNEFAMLIRPYCSRFCGNGIYSTYLRRCGIPMLPGAYALNIPNTELLSQDNERRLGGVRGAKKKAGGSSTNGRESAGRRLGIKVWPDHFASMFI